MGEDSEIDFQLKIKTLLTVSERKLNEVNNIYIPLTAIDPVKLESEDEIVTLIEHIHKTITNISNVVLDVKQFCVQLEIQPLYDLFKKVYATMGHCIKLLAETCQFGVERSLLKFSQKQSINMSNETLCTDAVNSQGLYHTSIVKGGNSCEISNLEMKRIYENIEKEKEAISRIAPSSASLKLNEVEISLAKILQDYNQILEEAESCSHNTQYDIGQRTYRPDYLDRVLKQQLSENIKDYFKQFTLKTIRRLYSDFYVNEVDRIKKEIINSKPPTRSCCQQTDMEFMKELNKSMKEKNVMDKLNQQLKKALNDKNQINERFSKIFKSNEYLSSKVYELEKKVSNRSNTSSHFRQFSEHKDGSTVTDLKARSPRNRREKSSTQIQQGGSITYIEQKDIEKSIVSKVIKKKTILRSYPKKKMHTEVLSSFVKEDHVPKFVQLNHLDERNSMNNSRQTKAKMPDLLIHDRSLSKMDTVEQYTPIQYKIVQQQQIAQHDLLIPAEKEQMDKPLQLVSLNHIQADTFENNFNPLFRLIAEKTEDTEEAEFSASIFQNLMRTLEKTRPKNNEAPVINEQLMTNLVDTLIGQENHSAQNSPSDENKQQEWESPLAQKGVTLTMKKKVSEPIVKNAPNFKSCLKTSMSQRTFLRNHRMKQKMAQRDYSTDNANINKRILGPQRFDSINIKEHKNEKNGKLIKESLEFSISSKSKFTPSDTQGSKQIVSFDSDPDALSLIKIRRMIPLPPNANANAANAQAKKDKLSKGLAELVKKYSPKEQQFQTLLSDYVMNLISYKKQNRNNSKIKKSRNPIIRLNTQ